MTRTEIGQTIVATHRFHITCQTFAAKVAGCRQVHLERFQSAVLGVIIIGDGGSGHFEIIATQKEQQSIASQAHNVGDQNECYSPLGLQLETLKYAAANEDANTGSRYGHGTSENTRLTFAHTELGL